MKKNLGLLAVLLIAILLLPGCLGSGGINPGDLGLQTGSLAGRVLEATDDENPESGAPIPNAVILLDTGESIQTDETGNFQIDDILIGEHLITIAAPGYNRAGGFVNISYEATTNVLIALSVYSGGGEPAPGEEEEQEATLRINTYGFSDFEQGWVAVKSIDVWEEGYGEHWYRSWDNDWFEPSYSLDCYNAVKGKYYHVTITWQNGDSDTHDVLLDMEDQSEYYYHY